MTPEQQRIAIAEACGCIDIHEDGSVWEIPPTMRKYVGDRQYVVTDWLPDYLNDLNAMHEAEKVLTEKQQDRYYAELSKNGTWFQCLHATASQRAEAFLKTIDKWKD